MSNCVSTMMLYLWARTNPNIPFSFFNVFNFRSCFLPHFMFMLILLSGYDPTMDLVGNLVGHLYFYLHEILPQIPETEGFKLLAPPKFLVDFCAFMRIHDFGLNDNAQGNGGFGWMF